MRCNCYVCVKTRKALLSHLSKEKVSDMFCKGLVSFEELEARYKQVRRVKCPMKKCLMEEEISK